MEPYQFTTEVKVIWRDLDALGHVNNAVYATYLETNRLEYLQRVTEGGITASGLILAELTITYKSQAMLGETLIVSTGVTEIRNSSFIMSSAIHERATGRLVATGRAVMVCFDHQTQRSNPMPPDWRQAIARFEGREF